MKCVITKITKTKITLLHIVLFLLICKNRNLSSILLKYRNSIRKNTKSKIHPVFLFQYKTNKTTLVVD